MGFPDELAVLPKASLLLTSSFILGRLLAHSESQLVLFLNGGNDAYLKGQWLGGFRTIYIYIHTHTYIPSSPLV